MENYTITQGSSLTIDVTLRDADGVVVTAYDGTQSITTSVWPGGNRAETFAPTTAWTDASAGTIVITITGDDSGDLDPGRYQILTRLDDAGSIVDIYSATLDILASPGTEADPRVYGDYDDMLMFGRSWLTQLQTEADEAGFAEQRARARTWLEDIAHAHWQIGFRDTWLTTQLDADRLMVTAQVREAVAKKALALVCEGQVGTGNASVQYAKLGRMYATQADYIVSCLLLQIDLTGDGIADFTIDCSCTLAAFG